MPRKPEKPETVAHLRAEIASALHDGACQTLSGIALMARVLSHRLETENNAARAQEVTELGELVERAAGELRDLIRELRPTGGQEGKSPRN